MSASRNLSEVVVTALGIKKRKNDFSYVTQEVNAEGFTKFKTSNPIAALTGNVSAMTSLQQTVFLIFRDWSLHSEKL